MSHHTDRDLTADDDTIRDGSLVIEERMNRRDGLVEYDGTVGAGTDTASETDRLLEGASSGTGVSPAMQAGASILGGTGTTAMVDDGASLVGGEPATGSAYDSTSGSSGMDMSTDNTASGRAASGTAQAGIIGMVRDKMKVVDANGEDLGKVEYIKLGDPQAATTAGQGLGAGTGTGAGVLGAAGSGTNAVSDGAATPLLGGDSYLGDLEPNVDEPLRSELLRSGFIKIDGKGWIDTDRYVPADQIASVANDTVMLSVTKERLLEA